MKFKKQAQKENVLSSSPQHCGNEHRGSMSGGRNTSEPLSGSQDLNRKKRGEQKKGKLAISGKGKEEWSTGAAAAKAKAKVINKVW